MVNLLRAVLSLQNISLVPAKKISRTKLSKSKYNSLLQLQSLNPVNIMIDQEKGKTWWMFQENFYVENKGLAGDDVKAYAMKNPVKKTK